MTQIVRVTQKQMEKETGLRAALGYSMPQKDKILLRKDLDKKTEKKVLAHEEEHMRKGEEGPFWGIVAGIAGSILGARSSSRAARRATDAQTAASERDIQFAEESRDLARGDQAPYREAGYTALDALMSLTGLAAPHRARTGGMPSAAARPAPVAPVNAQNYLGGLGGVRRIIRGLALRNAGGPVGRSTYNINEMGPESVYRHGSYTRSPHPMTIAPAGHGYVKPSGRVLGGPLGMDDINPNRIAPPPSGTVIDGATGRPIENPGGVEGGYQFQTDPSYQFRLGEGMRALERGGAAAGGLLSGGFARRAMRYGQDYASNEYMNVYNRIANIAGLGQVSAGQSGNAAMIAGGQMGNAAQNAGYARASGYTAEGNAWSNAINQISQLPWEDIFRRNPGDISRGGTRGPI